MYLQQVWFPKNRKRKKPNRKVVGMLQVLSQLIPVVFAAIIAYLTYRISKVFKNTGTGMFNDFYCFLEKTPAQDSFLMFIIQSVLVSAAAICSFKQISNHIILSLDILYFISLLMIILFHNLKEAMSPLVKEI
jgi:hypothetical protein